MSDSSDDDTSTVNSDDSSSEDDSESSSDGHEQVNNFDEENTGLGLVVQLFQTHPIQSRAGPKESQEDCHQKSSATPKLERRIKMRNGDTSPTFYWYWGIWHCPFLHIVPSWRDQPHIIVVSRGGESGLQCRLNPGIAAIHHSE